jgi:hypothetical protein
MDYEERGRYLASREWALLKRQVRERAHGICERCRRAPHQQTHHLTYARLGSETLDDLLGVCRACHEFLSAVSDHDPVTTYQGEITLGCLTCPTCTCRVVLICFPWTSTGESFDRDDNRQALVEIREHMEYARYKGNGDCDISLLCVRRDGHGCPCCCPATMKKHYDWSEGDAP